MTTHKISDPIISTPDDVYNLIKDGMHLEDKINYSHPKKTGGKVIRMSLGRVWANVTWPDTCPLIDEPLTQKALDKFIFNMFKKYGPEETSEYISKIQSEAFTLATLCPNTFNANIFIPPKEWVKKKQEFMKIADTLNPIEFKEKAEALTKELLKHIDDVGLGGENIMNSGAKGNPIEDWGMLLVAKGYVIDIEGNLLGPIIHSLNDGYNKIDYYNAGSESRKNFYIRSALSAHPGYLATQMAMANAGLQIDSKKKDCKTKKYFELLVTDEISNLIIGRNYINQAGNITLITPENIDKLVGKKIKMRSPLYCLSENGICETCYGELAKNLGVTNIGILATGAVNKLGINTMMKMRHMASSTSTKIVDFIKMAKASSIDIEDFKDVLEIQKNQIIAKSPCSITIDSSEYDDTSLIDCGDKYQIVGILNIQYGEEPNISYIALPYTFLVDLFKPSDFTVEGYLITLNYEPGEIIMKQDYYDDTFNERTLSRLFQGSAKYITNPEVLVMTIHSNLSGMDLVHIETIVSNMFRDAEDVTIQSRLNGYKNPIVLGQKKLPFATSWLNAMAFENINRAIKVGLLDNKDATFDPLEKIVMEKYGHEGV